MRFFITVQLFLFILPWVVSLFDVEMNLKTSTNHRSGQVVHLVMIKMEMWKFLRTLLGIRMIGVIWVSVSLSGLFVSYQVPLFYKRRIMFWRLILGGSSWAFLSNKLLRVQTIWVTQVAAKEESRWWRWISVLVLNSYCLLGSVKWITAQAWGHYICLVLFCASIITQKLNSWFTKLGQ